MKLIGMLDSPYVRRVAISLQLLGLRFEHQSLSVFRTFDEFSRINPVVKAPTLVCDDGMVLMDSTLMLEYAEALARPRSLMPAELPALQRELHRIGLALAACEKAVQVLYERQLRPAERQHEPWLQRVIGQLTTAFNLLDVEIDGVLPPTESNLGQAGVSIAVAWHFAQRTAADLLPAERYPALQQFSDAAERLPAFRAAPHGEGTVAAVAA